jgi:hypothetical protein
MNELVAVMKMLLFILLMPEACLPAVGRHPDLSPQRRGTVNDLDSGLKTCLPAGGLPE